MKTKSKQRNKTEGTMDRLAGRVMETIGKVTGNRKTKAKGKGARARGAGRTAKGRAKTGRR